MGRKDEVRQNRTGGYIETTNPTGYDVLINGTSKYLNFNAVSGVNGYGFRDNTGVMEYKDSGGAWASFSSLGTSVSIGGTVTGGTVGSVLFVSTGPTLGQDNSAFFWDETNNRLNLGRTSGTPVPTHTLHLSSTGNGIAVYNTADETNYERVVFSRSSNVATINTENGGTGTSRALRMTSSSGANTTSITIQKSGLPFITTFTSTNGSSGDRFRLWVGTTASNSSGSSTFMNIGPTINHSSTAGYTCLLVNPTESATGSGVKALANLQVGGTPRMFIGNTLATMVGYGTEVPTHTVTHSSGSTGMAMYSTADQITNYQRLRQIFSSGVYYLASGSGGTGVATSIRIVSNSSGVDNLTGTTTGYVDVSAGTMSYHGRNSPSTAILHNFITSGTGSSLSSGTFDFLRIDPLIAHSSTAGYNGLRISVTENSTGSGAKNLILGQVGGNTKFAFNNFGRLTFDATITAGGTTGNQTIDKPSGTVNIAAAGTTVTVTNSLCTTSSIVYAVVRTNDTTALIKNVVPGAGSFVINMNAAVTAETSIGFIVFN